MLWSQGRLTAVSVRDREGARLTLALCQDYEAGPHRVWRRQFTEERS
jgi:hypothetical protein